VTRIRLMKVLMITLAWTLLAAGLVIHDHLAYVAFAADVPEYSFGRALVSSILAALVGAPIAGTLVIFVIKERLRRRSLGVVVLAHTLTYMTVTATLTFVGNLAFYAQALDRPVTDPATLEAAVAWFLGPWTVKTMLFWTVVAAITSFAIELLDVLGPALTKDLVLARYHTAKTEQRCFMFLDIRSSTSIAERLGHTRYYGMLNDFYADVTEPIADSRGEIYQYVGDEVIVSWPGRAGIDDATCMRCFLRIQKIIREFSGKYMDRYDVVPGFKASFHYGEVTAGEIGVLKRDIVFTGDVLNTAARIQERCNVHNADALLSGDLVAMFPPAEDLRFTPVEEIELRGKATPTTVYRLEYGSSSRS